MKELTKAEEQVMQLLWAQEKAFIKELVELFPKPRPAYTTVATIMKILNEKKFVDYKSYGNSFQYFPAISKDEYYGKFLKTLVSKAFDNSFKDLVSFFTSKNRIDVDEVDAIIKMMKELKKSGYE